MDPTSTTSPRGHSGRFLPWIGALLVALLGLLDIESVVGGGIAPGTWRYTVLHDLLPHHVVRVSYALALPAGGALLLLSVYLLKRRQRAAHLSIALLTALGVLSLFKGLDLEGAALDWAVAGLLYHFRGAFTVAHAPGTLKAALWRVPLLGAAGIALATVVDWLGHRSQGLGRALAESSALLRDKKTGPLHFENHVATIVGHHFTFAWIPLGVRFIEIATGLGIAYVIFRPLAGPRTLPDDAERLSAADVVRTHGSDTLSFFKLRRDNHYFFSADRSAFVGYRVDSGVLVLSGDPVGPPEKFPELLVELRTFARRRGLKLGALGASERMRDLYRSIGMTTMYIGDEAIVETERFSLEGRAIRKVRQSVTRLKKNGYTAEVHNLATIDSETLAQVEHVLELGRQGRPEIGFSMGMDEIRGGACDADTLFVLARDEEHQVKGVLHFVPCYGRPAVSLSLMRRDPATPNGLTEFLVCESIAAMKERGIAEMSLNFATGARWIHEPQNPLEKLAGKVVVQLDRFLQLESLYRFNSKFGPRWEPRYLVFEGWTRLPRTGLAAIWIEGQLPKPTPAKIREWRGADDAAHLTAR